MVTYRTTPREALPAKWDPSGTPELQPDAVPRKPNCHIDDLRVSLGDGPTTHRVLEARPMAAPTWTALDSGDDPHQNPPPGLAADGLLEDVRIVSIGNP